MNLKTLLFIGGAAASVAFAPTASAEAPLKVPADAGKTYTAAPAKKATRAIEQETWKSIGTGQFRDNFIEPWYYVSGWFQMDVQIEESEQTPNRFRVLNPYHNYPVDFGAGLPTKPAYMIVDASDPDHCWVEISETHLLLGTLQDGSNAQLALWSIADDYYNNLYGDWEKAEAENVCGTLRDRCVTFPFNALLSTVVPDENPDWETLWKRCNGAGMFRLRLPDALKVDIELDFAGKEGDDLLFTVAMESDVEYAQIALVPGEFEQKMVDGIIDGSIKSSKAQGNGVLKIPYTEDGMYTLVAVPYAKGEPRAASRLTKQISFNEDEWRKCGKCIFSEGVLSSNEMRNYGFVIDFLEYEVEVEENVQQPGYIRLVDPYGLENAYSNPGTYDVDHIYYMEIDATYSDMVYVKLMDPIGLDLGYGRLQIWSRAGRDIENGKKISEINPALFGIHEDDRMTFPKDCMLLSFPDARADTWYYANEAGKFAIEFQPNQLIGGKPYDNSGVDNVIADRQAAEWFTMDGVRLEKAPSAPGLYIYRNGDTTKKIRL